MNIQKTTSKTSLLKLMLLRAWRERWTDSRWGINIKTVLPRGVSGDVYNLADCILQQAVIGSTANMILLSYLRHSLCSHLISYAAVLKRVSKYDGYDKIFCIIALLKFIESIIVGVTCRGKAEESILSNALLSLVYWLVNIYENSLDAFRKNEYFYYEQEMVERVSHILEEIVNAEFLMACIFIGKHENSDLFFKIVQKCSTLTTTTSTLGFNVSNQCIEASLKKIVFVDLYLFNVTTDTNSNETETITYCLQPILAVEVLLHPSRDTQILVTQLLMIKHLKSYTRPRLYCEIIRSCLTSLYSVIGTSSESIWCAFTFKKVPHILKQLNRLSKNYDPKFEYSSDVVEVFSMLANEPILDYIDTKYASNTLECLLNSVAEHKLVDKNMPIERDDSIHTSLSKIDVSPQQPSTLFFVMKVPPLTDILKALAPDYNKKPEALLDMLFQVLSSFELILAIAAVEGKLKTVISRLIRCNEMSINGATSEPNKIRSLVFDLSFLMLTFIIQTYGSDVVMDERGDSFYEKWARECMIERKKKKSPMNMVQICDPSKVDELLSNFNAPENPLKTSTLKWHEICMNIPAVLYHVLLAWENEQISATEVKSTLDSIKVRLSSFSVCAASWLCSYMEIVQYDELLKPMNMLQQFLQPSNCDDIPKDLKLEIRFGLGIQIIRKMQYDIHPPTNVKIRAHTITHNLVSQIPLEEQFSEVWKIIFAKGRLPVESTQTLESLLQSCGSLWLVTKLINEIMQCKYTSEMIKTMDIVFGIMHLDIERCTISLLSELLPILLLNKSQKLELCEPQSPILARLCVYCILSTIACCTQNNKRTPSTKYENQTELNSATKIRKLNTDTNDINSGEFLYENISAQQIDKSINQYVNISEEFKNCLQDLFKMFGQFIIFGDLSPKTYFIFQFLSLLVQCGRERVKPILKFLPLGLIQNLLKVIVTGELTVGFILRMYDLTTITGRALASSDLCLLRNIQLKKNSINL